MIWKGPTDVKLRCRSIHTLRISFDRFVASFLPARRIMSDVMKTGRLLKFHRPGGDIHAYFYQEGDEVRAAIYLMSAGVDRGTVHRIAGPSDDQVEAEVRAWVESHYPRPPR